jgi:hypothetical protein
MFLRSGNQKVAYSPQQRRGENDKQDGMQTTGIFRFIG